MNPYHKIQSIYKRDPDNKYKTFLEGQFSIPEFELLANIKWVFTEKVDGTNVRVMYKAGELRYGGKSDKAHLPMDLVENMDSLFRPNGIPVDSFKKTFNDEVDVCLYGEGYGPGIQKIGGKYRKDKSFVLFDIKINNWWLKRSDVVSISDMFGIDVVPVIGEGSLYDGIDIVRNGMKSVWGDFEAEGIVARPAVELRSRSGQRIITKIKCKDFKY